jgi:hypothetical protein
MNYVLENCIFCDSSDIFKIPSISITKDAKKVSTTSKRPGKIVDEYIKQTKKDVEQQKRNLRRELD